MSNYFFSITRLSVPLSALMFAGAFISAHADEPAGGAAAMEVEHFVWTDAVDRNTRAANRIFNSPAAISRVYFWTQLKGSRALLEELKRRPDGRMRVRHQWFRYDVDELSADQEVEVNLDVGRKADLRNMSYEVDALGFFRWRVWSSRQSLSPGWWRVDIVDEDDRLLTCAGASGPQPCSILFQVL